MLTTLTAYKSVIHLGPFPTSYGGVVGGGAVAAVG